MVNAREIEGVPHRGKPRVSRRCARAYTAGSAARWVRKCCLPAVSGGRTADLVNFPFASYLADERCRAQGQRGRDKQPRRCEVIRRRVRVVSGSDRREVQRQGCLL
jgi:hypothetical protein